MSMHQNDCWIETVSGKQFHFFDPQPDQIDIFDIAHALSLTCRFAGHTNRFYSVAEHCLCVSEIVPPEHALAALLHDASEAYLTDMPKPIKEHLSEYSAVEDIVMQAIANKFNFTYPLDKSIKHADLVMLNREAMEFLKSKGNSWSMWNYVNRPSATEGLQPLGLDSNFVRAAFLNRFYKLNEQNRTDREAA